jgi:hypothetical protein
VPSVKQCTRVVFELIKATVNRGPGTNKWNIPKFIDMMVLPEYMSSMASTGRFHCGFAEQGLKNWVKKTASTAQKCKGGVFEGQCASCIREGSMITHAVTMMEMQEDYLEEEEETPLADGSVGGSCFHIYIQPQVNHPTSESKRSRLSGVSQA